jgi:tight adherence protein C
VAVVLFLAFFGAAWFLVSGLTVHQREIALSLRRARRAVMRNQREIETSRGVSERVLTPLVGRLAAVTMRLTPKTSPEAVRARLISAGLARTVTPQAYLAMKSATALIPLVVAALMFAGGARLGALMVAGGGLVLGFIAPEFVISSRVRRRQEDMQAELPNVLDLLCVSVEAGLGFDQALAKLSERMSGPLVDEFTLVLHEMRIGQTRAIALKNLADRTGVPEVGQFVRALVQADQLGIALSRILRVQSADMRLRRQLAAEEKAMKAPVKMLFPVVLFIFPAMFIVVLGPAGLTLMNTLGGS